MVRSSFRCGGGRGAAPYTALNLVVEKRPDSCPWLVRQEYGWGVCYVTYTVPKTTSVSLMSVGTWPRISLVRQTFYHLTQAEVHVKVDYHDWVAG